MFSVNGFAMDNPELGWVETEDSTVIASSEFDLIDLGEPGRDGVHGGLGGAARPSLIRIAVETPRAHESTLRAIFDADQLVVTEEGLEGIQAECELASISPDTEGPADAIVELRATLRIPGVYWRDTDTTTSDAVELGGASVQVEVFEGLSAPVYDALVRVAGGASGIRVEGARGSFFEYGEALPEGSYLRFDASTGRAWVTTSDTWTGGTEVTQHITNGAPPYFLELRHSYPTPGDPTDRVAVLTVKTSARSGASVQVRGRRAHRI